jgi:hypothetical protein
MIWMLIDILENPQAYEFRIDRNREWHIRPIQ